MVILTATLTALHRLASRFTPSLTLMSWRFTHYDTPHSVTNTHVPRHAVYKLPKYWWSHVTRDTTLEAAVSGAPKVVALCCRFDCSERFSAVIFVVNCCSVWPCSWQQHNISKRPEMLIQQPAVFFFDCPTTDDTVQLFYRRLKQGRQPLSFPTHIDFWS